MLHDMTASELQAAVGSPPSTFDGEPTPQQLKEQRAARAPYEQAQRAPRLFVPAGELTRLPQAIKWLVRPILEQHTLTMVQGDPESGKSLLEIDQAACVATNTDWHGFKVTHGPVIYFAGEGHAGMRRRLKAWEVERSISLEGAPLYVSSRAVPFLDAEALTQAAHEIDALPNPPVLIVVDTLARAFAGGDENSAADAGRFVAACDALRDRYGAAVKVVHHTGHAAKDRGRGSSAFRGAVDVEIGVSRNEDVITVQCLKMKDAERFKTMAFRIKGVALPWTDDEGQPIHSAVIEPTDPPDPKATKPSGKNQSQALTVLQRLIREHRQNLEDAGHDPDKARVLRDDWRAACEAEGMDVKKRFYEAAAALTEARQVKSEPPYVYIP